MGIWTWATKKGAHTNDRVVSLPVFLLLFSRLSLNHLMNARVCLYKSTYYNFRYSQRNLFLAFYVFCSDDAHLSIKHAILHGKTRDRFCLFQVIEHYPRKVVTLEELVKRRYNHHSSSWLSLKHSFSLLLPLLVYSFTPENFIIIQKSYPNM